jgi:hypothetical protein
VVGRVVLDDVGRVVRVDLVNVLPKLAAWLRVDLLNLLEASALEEGSFCFEIGREGLGELSTDVGQDLGRSNL